MGSSPGKPVITNAIIGQLLHRAYVINIRKGLSYRTQGPDAPQLGTVLSSQ